MTAAPATVQRLRQRWRRTRDRQRLARVLRRNRARDGAARIEALAARMLADDPASQPAYRALGRLLSDAGDELAAARAARARLSPEQQQRLWPNETLPAESRHGASFRKIHAASRTPIRSAAAHRTAALQPYANEPLSSPDALVAIIENATLWYDGTNAIVRDADGCLIHAASTGNAIPALIAARRTAPVAIETDGVLLGAPGTGNYYHWTADVLPRVQLTREAGVSSDATWVLPALPCAFQRSTLRLADIAPDRVHLTASMGRHLQLRRLFVPLLDNRLGLHGAAWQFDGVAALVGVDRHAPRAGAGRRLFIARDAAGTGRRCLSNPEPVHAVARAHGFEICYPDRLSVVEQARTFADADRVVGAHGAGLVNLMYCKPGTRVLELHGHYLEPCYWALCEIGGLHYDALDCSSIAVGTQASPQGRAEERDQARSQNWAVPIEPFEAALAALD